MQEVSAPQQKQQSETMYIDLLKKCVTRSFENSLGEIHPFKGSRKRLPYNAVSVALSRVGLTLARLPSHKDGPDTTTQGETMVGMARLQNVQDCTLEIIRQRIPGDLIEAGVWRGGVTILMKGILEVYGDTERTVWVADSFGGLPKPDEERYPADAGDSFWTQDWMIASLEEVMAHFAQYGLLDDRVRFLKGWFRDTLPDAPIEKLSLLRIDGDMYESTKDALSNLYRKLSPGGFVIVDDYGTVPGCKAAVDDYRREHEIRDEIIFVRDAQMGCIHWRKTK